MPIMRNNVGITATVVFHRLLSRCRGRQVHLLTLHAGTDIAVTVYVFRWSNPL